MKRFFFRLETLLKVRKAREGRLQRELAYTRQKWTQLKEKEDSVDNQMSALMEEIRQKREKKELSLQETYSQLLEHLKVSHAQIREAVLMQSKQVEEKQAQLRQLVQDRRVIEKIKEKQLSEWRVKSEYSEGALLDEISLTTHAK